MADPADRYELCEVGGGWALVANDPPAVPADQPPPSDMPPLILLVLEALADDDETIHTLRDCGNVPPYGLALVGEQHILNALRAGLADGLISVSGEFTAPVNGGLAGKGVAEPGTDDASLRRYWFALTAAGEDALAQAGEALARYWERLPIV